MPYLLFLKKLQNLKLSSAAIIGGALRVNRHCNPNIPELLKDVGTVSVLGLVVLGIFQYLAHCSLTPLHTGD